MMSDPSTVPHTLGDKVNIGNMFFYFSSRQSWANNF